MSFIRAPTPTSFHKQLKYVSSLNTNGWKRACEPIHVSRCACAPPGRTSAFGPVHPTGPALSSQSHLGSGVISSHPPGSDEPSRHQGPELSRQSHPSSGVISSHPLGQHHFLLDRYTIKTAEKMNMPAINARMFMNCCNNS